MFIMQKYWEFDVDSYIRDYPKTKVALKIFTLLLDAYQQHAKEDATWEFSFPYRAMKAVLKQKKRVFKGYIQCFEQKWVELKESEKEILKAFYFDYPDDSAAAEAVVEELCNLKRSSIYARKVIALNKVKEGALKQEPEILSKYWIFYSKKFIGDYQSNMDLLDDKKEHLEETVQTELPAFNKDSPHVQTSMKEYDMLRKFMVKQNLEKEIADLQVYEKIFLLVWGSLTEKDRDYINTFFFDDYASKLEANLALQKKYGESRNGVYIAKGKALDNLNKLVNGA